MTATTLEALLSEVRETDVVSICRQLVRIKSVNPPGSELAIAEYVAGVLRESGLDVELVAHGPDRASVLARLKGSGELPGLLYSAHLDTVPVGAETWLHDPFGGEVADGKVWGRGSADMKGTLAAMMVAAKVLAATEVSLRGDLILAATAGEEVDSLGAVALAARPDLGPVQAVIVGEPSYNDLYVAEKGALWLELTTHGKTAHGSMPDLGRNAVVMMVALLSELNRLSVPYTEHPILGSFSQSINTIAGGVKTNVVPHQCTATVDMRTVPGQNHKVILRQVEELIASLEQRLPNFCASVKIINDRPPLTTSLEEPVVRHFADVVMQVTGQRPVPKGACYFTDAVAFVPVLKAPMIICGPGQARMAHQPDEHVEVSKLVESARLFTLAAARLLA